MSLQVKVVLILVGALACIVVLQLAVDRFVLMPSFVELEGRAALEDADRCVRAIEREVEHVDRNCHDWAAWDDMYANALAPSPEHIAANLDVETFIVNRLSVGQIVGTDGRVVWQQAVDLGRGAATTLEGLPTDRYPLDHVLLGHLRAQGPPQSKMVRGILMVGDRPLLVASRPILTTTHGGPARGSLILGHFLTDRDVRRLTEQTRVAFHVVPAGGGRGGGPETIEPVGPGRLRVRRVMTDLAGGPALAIVAEVPRDITRRGETALDEALLVTGLSSLVILMLVTLFALRFSVLRPLSALLRHARRVKSSGEYSTRLAMGRRDEVGVLADAFDQLMEVIARDITDREKTEARLRESDRLYRLLTDTVGDLIALCDADGRLVHLSSSYGEILGADPGGYLGRRFADLAHPEDRDAVASALSTGSDPARVVDVVYRMAQTRGEEHWYETFGKVVVGPDGTPSGWVFNTRDVTERKRAEDEREHLEAQLRQAQKMEAIGRLAGGVAHDFNNLLTSITLAVEVLLAEAKQGGEGREDLLEIKRSAERAAALTGQLLAFSRKQVIAPKVVDLDEILASSTAMLKRLIGEDVELVFKPGGGRCRVKVDPIQMEQVLINLAVNARDAMPDGGTLNIETTEVAVDAEACRGFGEATPGRYVRWQVRDTGTGMTAEVRARLFEPFFTTKEQGRGTGLGLPTVYGIVRQNLGFVDVRSEVGKGSTFAIYLPVVEAEGSSPPSPPEEPSYHGTETILVVEDDEPVGRLARRLLEKAGYRVVLANRGDEALAAVEADGLDPDLLLTDVVMPGMSGKALFERLVPLCPGLRVVYMSGYTADVIDHHGVLEPDTDLVQKPFTPRSLLARVRAALDASAVSSPGGRPVR